jgi:hypothetical protein
MMKVRIAYPPAGNASRIVASNEMWTVQYIAAMIAM